VGRPKDLSPKAWFNSRVLFTQEPFDRHDWYVEAENGEARRYVIDFYEGKEKRDVKTSIQEATGPIVTKPPSMYIDARPALDNPSAAVDRMVMALRETLPGIASAFDSYKLSSSDTAGATADANAQIKTANQTERQ
jgi:cytochrome c heme-lyase